MFFVPCSCSLSFIRSTKQKQDHWAKNRNTPNITIDTHNKNKGQRVNNEYNEQCQHNFEVHTIKRQEHSQTTVNVVVVVYWLLLLYIRCCWMCSLFLVLGSWVDGFVMSVLFIANDYCSCYLFHIRVLCSILFSKTKPRSGNTKTRKPQQ